MNPMIIPVILSVLAIGISIYLFVIHRKLQQQFDQITRGVKEKDLVELVSTFSKQEAALTEDIAAMNKQFLRIQEDTKRFFRRVGLVRYQGFNDTGGDQSFSIALIDETDSGFILTSLYGRDFSKTYAKKIDDGKASHTLTDEEQEALDQARNS